MKTLIIDRFEGKYAICEDKDQKYFAIETSEMPQGAKTGDVLSVNDEEGTLEVDRQETERRKSRKRKK